MFSDDYSKRREIIIIFFLVLFFGLHFLIVVLRDFTAKLISEIENENETKQIMVIKLKRAMVLIFLFLFAKLPTDYQISMKNKFEYYSDWPRKKI